MTFKDYLISRRIDPSAFAKNEPRRYREFGLLYDQVHIKSFVMQKLFILNSLRTQYPHTGPEDKPGTETKTTPKAKPMIKKPQAGKPKMAKPGVKSAAGTPKPVIGAKPKIPKKPTGESADSEGKTSESKAKSPNKARPKIQPRPIIKKK